MVDLKLFRRCWPRQVEPGMKPVLKGPASLRFPYFHARLCPDLGPGMEVIRQS
jgi:hypothetical protein